MALTCQLFKLARAKMVFTNLEKRDMLKIYYSVNRNSQISSELYLEQYPERPQPHYSFFNTLDRNLGLFGSFNKPRNAYGERVEAEDTEAVINAVSFVEMTIMYCVTHK